jgi:hypothetical protein
MCIPYLLCGSEISNLCVINNYFEVSHKCPVPCQIECPQHPLRLSTSWPPLSLQCMIQFFLLESFITYVYFIHKKRVSHSKLLSYEHQRVHIHLQKQDPVSISVYDMIWYWIYMLQLWTAIGEGMERQLFQLSKTDFIFIMFIHESYIIKML